MRFLPMGNYSGESDCFVLFYFHQETCNNGRRPVDPNPNYPIYYLCFFLSFKFCLKKVAVVSIFLGYVPMQCSFDCIMVAGCVIVSEIVIVVSLYACLVLVLRLFSVSKCLV